MNTERLLIVGAGSDIGQALIQFIVTSRPQSQIMAHCRSLSTRPNRGFPEQQVQWCECDLSDPHAIRSLAQTLLTQSFIPTGIVFLPALPFKYERLSKFDFDFFQNDLAIQVQAPIILVNALATELKKLTSASLVFVNSSVTRGLPPKHLSMYTIVKHAQLGLMKAIAAEYSDTCIRANAVSPSMLDTKFLVNLPQSLKEGIAASMPSKRNVDLQAVILTIDFLLGSASSSITGVEIPVAGGSVI
jgi:3-oxoacyl-[acyl-carrier protein] reductase